VHDTVAGIDAVIVDDDGKPVTRPEAGGYLVIKKPWPSMLRTLWRDNDRYLSSYWEKFNNRYYVAGDSARRDKDGYFWIMGRIDDVLNVAGHRLGTMEIESALVANPRVAEAAVVGKPHDIKGEAVFAFVVCRGPRPVGDTRALVQELRNWVGEQVGAIAKPDDIRFADNLPKTRSGKIMRRLLRSIARGEEILQDVSTLENPAILDQLRGADPESGEAEAPTASAASAARAPAKTVPAASSAAKKAPRRSQLRRKRPQPGRQASPPANQARPGKQASLPANQARPGKQPSPLVNQSRPGKQPAQEVSRPQEVPWERPQNEGREETARCRNPACYAEEDAPPREMITPSLARRLRSPSTISPSRSRCVEMTILPTSSIASSNETAWGSFPRFSATRKRWVPSLRM